jgi:hypothetical protein
MHTLDPEQAENLLWTGLNNANLLTVQRALEMGADVNQRHREGAGAANQFGLQDTPLHGAFKPSPWSTGARARKTSKADVSKMSAIVKLLIKQGADVTALDELGNTPLMCMALNHKLKFDANVETLLIEKTKQAHMLNQSDKVMGYTALHHAALTGNSRLTIKICKAGADIQVIMKDGTTPFFAAANGFLNASLTGKTTQVQRHQYTLDALLNFKAHINERNGDGDTVAERYPAVPLSVWLGRGLDPASVHPLTGNNLMDLHLQRLEFYFHGSVFALATLMETTDLLPCKPELGMEQIKVALGSREFEQPRTLLSSLQVLIEQQLLQRETEHASSVRVTPRL